MLSKAGVFASDVDRVFTTGGRSLEPAVRARLAARFGEARLVGGEELTSVVWALYRDAPNRHFEVGVS